MARIDETYKDILVRVLKRGHTYKDPNREGVTRKELPFVQIEHNLKNGFPLITTRKVNFKNIVTELLWFLKGDPNIKYLVDNGCNIWNGDAYNRYKSLYGSSYGGKSFEGDLNKFKNLITEDKITVSVGKLYPKQWRKSGTRRIDQISNVINLMRTSPMSSEMIVNSWIPEDLMHMALPPCHYSFQVVCRPYYGGIGFYIVWNQRSTDLFLGCPYNIASYSLLAKILEKLTGLKAIGVVGNLNKVHLYDNQLKSAEEQSDRDVYKYDSPDILIDLDNNVDYLNITIDDFLELVSPDSFKLIRYDSYPAINIPMLARDN